MLRQIIVVAADEHAGSTVGLMNPETILEKDDCEQIVRYNPQLSPYQELLWEIHEHKIQAIEELAHGDEVIFIHNGDLTRGNKYTDNWVSSRLSDQIIIAYYNIKPWFSLPNLKCMRLSKGTGSHVFGEGSAEIIVSEMLRREHPRADITVVYHGLLDVNGCTIDYAHHGPHPGTRDWLRGNVAQLYLKDLMMRQLKRGVIPPNLVLRAHYHSYTRVVQVLDWGGKEYESMLVVSPSMSGPDDFTTRVTRSLDTITNGYIALELIDGKIINVHPMNETIDLRIKDMI